MTDTAQERIRRIFGSLTRAERQLTDAILDNYPMSGLGSITRLAEKAGVSTPTVARTVQKLGFSGFPEFQEALAVADRVVLGPLHRPWKYAPETLFDFRAATEYFAARGIPFLQQDDVSLIPDWLDADLQENELWVIFSNGSFNGLRDLLRTRFGGQS